MKYLFVILFFNFIFSIQAQDCTNAVLLTDSVYQAPAPKNGGRQELGFNSMKDLYYFQKEHHTIWYKFTARKDCELTFEIIPQNIEDDYDFLLFQSNSQAICEDIFSKKLKPIRTNISRNNTTIQSYTGLKTSSLQNFIPSGIGEAYSRSVQAKKGDNFILVVDNVYINGKGHTLKVFDCLSQEIIPEIIEKEIIAMTKSDTLQIGQNQDTEKPSLTDSIPETLLFDTLEVGEVVILEHVYFHGNSSFVKMESATQLSHLLKFMQENPMVKVRIHAHTNGDSFDRYSQPKNPKMDVFAPNSYMAHSSEFCDFFRGNALKLSLSRANSIHNYLVNHGIDAARIERKGWGARKMLVPDTSPRSDLNRRVEIELIP